MLPDIAAETLQLVRADAILKAVGSHIPSVATPIIEKWINDIVEPHDICQLEAFCQYLESTYLEDGIVCLRKYLLHEPRHLFALEQVCSLLASELRFRGWSDVALKKIFDICGASTSGTEFIDTPVGRISIQRTSFRCYVAVRAWRLEDYLNELTAGHGFKVVSRIGAARMEARLPKTGPYVEIRVDAWDQQSAAEIAYSRVSNVLGALAIFQPKNVEVRSRVVGVEVSNDIKGVEVVRPLPIETRHTNKDELTRIVRSARASAEAGAPAQGKLLTAIRSIVPRAVCLAKLRTDIADLAAAIEHLGLPTINFNHEPN